jgi:alcohol dehydrogenase
MLPMIAVPTTAGTGSEAQTYALISKPGTHEKMACGDEKAGFRTAILDPYLLLSQPAGVRATAGFDAISHATETWVTKGRNAISDCFAREAWRLLEPNYERMLAYPDDLESLGAMQVGAHLAGLAIENSMLGATHACANPLTARYGTEHGVAIAVLLPAVVKWNGAAAGARYAELLALCAHQRAGGDATDALALRLEQLARAGGLPASLAEIGVPHEDLTTLAGLAALQWTGRFNPRPLDAAAALEIYECAY